MSKLHFWFKDGFWWCGAGRDACLRWYGLTPTEAARARWDWLHAKDEERP